MARTKMNPMDPMSPMMNNSMNNDSPYSFSSFVSLISNNFIVIFLVVLAFLGGFYAGSLWTENQLLKSGKLGGAAAPTGAAAPAAPEGPTADQLKAAPKVSAADHVRGDKNAKITLIEYSDFECPFCARFHPTMLQVMKEYDGKVKWVFRHYPLSFHPNAQKAAEASECVAKQLGEDGFWKYGDKIFEENNKLGGKISPDAINASAQAAGVNMDAFKKCLDGGEFAQKVKDAMDGGAKAGISGTPGTIILTEKGEAELIPGALPFEQIKVTLQKYL